MLPPVLLPPPNEATTDLQCYHCHETCPDERLHLEEKHFCCQGCKMVYEILNEHGLCDFYKLDENAGQSLKSQKSSKAYAYLDDAEVQEKLLEFSSENKSQVTFYLPQVHCVSCIWLLENLYKLDAGVSHSRVNFLKKTATIIFDPTQTSLRKIASLLSSIGYPPEINLGDVDKTTAPKISRKLAYQLAIAGFAFGNIMLFSFPDYVGMDAETYGWFSNIFGYISLALALPVLLFSAKDYFISAWQGLRTRQLNIDIPLCLALTSLFGRSVWEILTHTGPGYLDSFAGLTFLLLIGRWFQQHTWHQLSFERDYKSYFPVAATVKTGEKEQAVPIHRLVPGDIILVRSQEIIPADGILLKGSAQVDYSFVTGEANPVRVQSGERIFAGGKQMGQSIEISLIRRVSQSSLTRLWNDNAFKTASKGNTTKLADQAGRIFSWLILGVGGGAFLYWSLWQHNIATAINAFTAVMIIACPCTVALSIPFTLGNIQRILGRHRFYLKNINVVEAFSAINAVVFDKTGTITNIAQQSFEFLGKQPNYAEKIAIRSLTRHSAHPLSRWIYDSMPQVPVEKPEWYEEVPGLGIRGKVGGLELKIGSAAFVVDPQQKPLTPNLTQGKSGVFIAVNGSTLGFYEVKSRYRDGLAEVLGYFRDGIKRSATTPLPPSPRAPKGGVHLVEPEEIATMSSRMYSPFRGSGGKGAGGKGSGGTGQANPPNTWLLSGDQDQDAARLAPFFSQETMLFNHNPQDKLDFIKTLQINNQKIMMIGDGLNDAGALRQSDLGIVIAENTNNFTPACDAILHADEFENLPKFVQLARSGVKIVHWSYGIAVLYNIIGLSIAVGGQLSPLVAAILMPVSSISIVLFGVGMGNWTAYGLRRTADGQRRTAYGGRPTADGLRRTAESTP